MERTPRRDKNYRYVAASIPGWVQRVAVDVIRHGYWFYSKVEVRRPSLEDGKARRRIRETFGLADSVEVTEDLADAYHELLLEQTDGKLINKYGIGITKWYRALNKQAGRSNIHYVRYDDFGCMFVTKGVLECVGRDPDGRVLRAKDGEPVVLNWFEEEDWKDVRRDVLTTPWGYSIRLSRSTHTGKWHPSVQISDEFYLVTEAWYLERALQPMDELFREFRLLGRNFAPYARVKKQFKRILHKVNVKRRAAGLPAMPIECLPYFRRSVKPFETEEVAEGERDAA